MSKCMITISNILKTTYMQCSNSFFIFELNENSEKGLNRYPYNLLKFQNRRCFDSILNMCIQNAYGVRKEKHADLPLNVLNVMNHAWTILVILASMKFQILEHLSWFHMFIQPKFYC